MRHIRLHLLTLLLMCPGAMAAAPPSRSFLTRPVLIPIEVVRSGHIAIRAKINGQGPYRFIFDTGAPALVISPEVAKDSRILPRDFEKPFFTFLGNLGNFDVRSIALGRARQSNLQADIWNHPTVELMSKAYGRFEGLIGFPFFAHYQLTIDYKSKTMTLVPCAFEPVDTQQKMVGRLTAPQEPKSFAPKALLGVAVTKSKTDEDAGVVISAVSPGSPADDAGVKPGDRLLVLDGRWTDSVDDCYAALSAVESARQFTVVVLRHHQQISLVVHPARGL